MKKILLFCLFCSVFIFTISMNTSAAGGDAMISVCRELDAALHETQDLAAAAAVCVKVKKLKAPGKGCTEFAADTAAMISRFREYNGEPLKMYFLADGIKFMPQEGRRIQRLALLNDIIEKYPDSGLVPYAHYLLAEYYHGRMTGDYGSEAAQDPRNAEEALAHLSIITEKYKAVKAMYGIGIIGMKQDTTLAVMSLFNMANIYVKKEKIQEAEKALYGIIDNYGNEKDAEGIPFKIDAYVQMLQLYAGWMAGVKIAPENAEKVRKISAVLLAMPESKYLSFYYRATGMGSAHAECLMALAQLDNDITYYEKIIAEMGDKRTGPYASENTSCGVIALAELKKVTISPDKKIATYIALAGKTKSSYMKADLHMLIAQTYRDEIKDPQAALDEYQYVADNFKIPYPDPEALGHGEGYADTAKEMIGKIREEMKKK